MQKEEFKTCSELRLKKFNKRMAMYVVTACSVWSKLKELENQNLMSIKYIYLRCPSRSLRGFGELAVSTIFLPTSALPKKRFSKI